MAYRALIESELDRCGLRGVLAYHVEAWMRLEHGTLDYLSEREFRSSARISAYLASWFPAMSADLAATYGLAHPQTTGPM